ncbi:nudix hydrolase 20, chloroplastic-like [Bufo gargarizans]|uniref:nudix hydrolase 20, chloroplastic-like n=1 Tax=Bufo gargarizans TaxID=30331 RepID=UPI001CF20975|nr:nudix hydrolase 20, chloroplastic-like [Bufo gargarizans]XP_044133860.1 nudix hydrolase 20, chloroplastic-like [Bufo gargarizans]
MALAVWSERVLDLLLKMNNMQHAGCLPFCVQGQRVGWVTQPVAQVLLQSSDIFTLYKEDSGARLELSDRLRSPHERTRAVQEVMEGLRDRGAFPCLQEWRDEQLDVKTFFSDPPLLSVERAATPLLGVSRRGVNVNGFLRRGSKIFMWIARRSLTKPSYPGMLDHLAAGAISAGSGVWETLLKECEEEACIPESLASKARPAGTVSYAYEKDDALYLECEFVFDLEVPESFQPHAGDGEVQEFYLWPLDKVRDAIATQEFKPNCALAVLDFLIRNGHIQPDEEKYYTKFVENLHRPL